MTNDAKFQEWFREQARIVRKMAQDSGRTTRDVFLSVQMRIHFDGLHKFPGETTPAKFVEYELFA